VFLISEIWTIYTQTKTLIIRIRFWVESEFLLFFFT